MFGNSTFVGKDYRFYKCMHLCGIGVFECGMATMFLYLMMCYNLLTLLMCSALKCFRVHFYWQTTAESSDEH